MTLIGYWPLHDQNATDYSGNNNHGTLNGGVTTGVAGKGGLQAMSFDGADDYITTPLTVSGDGTLLFWFNPSTTADDTRLISTRDTSNDADGVFTMRLMSGNIEIWNESNNGWQTAWGSTIETDTWYHGAVVYDVDALEWTFYLDGDKGNTQSVNGYSLSHLAFASPLVTSGTTSGGHFAGELFGGRYYSRQLSQTEIQTLYDWGSGDYASPPGPNNGGVSHYSFNNTNNDTTIAKDQWNSNDGTVNGATHQSSGGPRNDGAYSFDGSSDDITTSQFLQVNQDWSVSIWLHANTPQDTSYDIMLSDENVGTWFGINNGGNGTLQEYYTSSNNYSSFQLTANNWYHITVINKDNKGKTEFWVNGIQNTESYSSYQSTNSSNTMHLGSNTGGQNFDGIIDQVRFYNRALTPKEIHELYQNGTKGKDMRKHLVNRRQK